MAACNQTQVKHAAIAPESHRPALDLARSDEPKQLNGRRGVAASAERHVPPRVQHERVSCELRVASCELRDCGAWSTLLTVLRRASFIHDVDMAQDEVLTIQGS